MKTYTNVSLRLVSVLALLSLASVASAYYDPGVQRWINRDSLGEPAFDTRHATVMFQARAKETSQPPARSANLYGFADNAAVDLVDHFGLFTSRPPTPIPLPAPDPDPVPAPCGDFTNKDCRAACDSAFGTKNKALQVCYQICAGLKGKTCNQLWSYCGHIARHGDFGNQGGKICYSLYDTLCYGR
jgi:hypothetical protein